MVKITNGSRITVVTKGAFEELYKPYGWKICDLSEEKSVADGLFEKEKIEDESVREVPNSDTPEEDTAPEEEETEVFEIPLSEMKLNDLKAYAAEHDIDISAARTKQDIRAIIRAEMEV